MEAIEFISNYELYVHEIRHVIKPEFLPAIEKLQQTDAHDLITPETWFINDTYARGYVWSLFLTESRINNP